MKCTTKGRDQATDQPSFTLSRNGATIGSAFTAAWQSREEVTCFAEFSVHAQGSRVHFAWKAV